MEEEEFIEPDESHSNIDSTAIKLEGQNENSILSYEQGNSSPEIEKMKAVIRQLFREKEKLKKDIETECKEHKNDVGRLSEEIKMINIEIKRLNEEKNLTQLPSPEEEAKIHALTKQLSDLKSSLKSIQSNISDSKRENSVIEKEVEQYKMTISTLEEDLFSSEEDKVQCLNLQTKLSNLEDEKREKQRMIDELIISERLSTHELQKVKNKIDLIKAGNPLILDIEMQAPTFIYQPVSKIPSAVLSVYKDLNRFNTDINSSTASPNLFPDSLQNEKNAIEEKINNFILTFPRQIQILEEENERISEQCQEFKEKYQRLKSIQKNEHHKSGAITNSTNNEINQKEESSKMAKIVKDLSVSNHAKTIKLRDLKELADQQHASLQRLVGIPKANESIISSLRQVLDQLEKCDQSDCQNLCDIGEKLLDAMVGVGSNIQ